MNSIEHIHERAVEAARNLKRSEQELLDALILVDENSVFKERGYGTLHDYCVMELGLTDAQAYTFIGIARTSKVSNARRIVPLLSQENKSDLLEKAKDLSYRQLERELIKTHPEKMTKERIRPVTEMRLEMKVYISPEMEKNLRRMQDVLSQKLSKPCSMEEVLEFMAAECLERHDPVKKAERVKPKLVALPKSQSRTIPASIAHLVAKRDQGQCTFILPNGKRCPSQRWLHAHHKTPWAEEGSHSAENLTTLCSTHHRFTHDRALTRAKIDGLRAGPMAR